MENALAVSVTIMVFCVDVYNIAQMAALCWFGGQLVYCPSCDTYYNKLDAGAPCVYAVACVRPSRATQGAAVHYILRPLLGLLRKALRCLRSCS